MTKKNYKFDLVLLENDMKKDSHYLDLLRFITSKIDSDGKIILDFGGDDPPSFHMICRIPLMLWATLGEYRFNKTVVQMDLSLQSRLVLNAQKIVWNFLKKPRWTLRKKSSTSRFDNIGYAVSIFDGNVAQMSRALGVSRTAIYKWEKSGVVPLDIFETLCELDGAARYRVPHSSYKCRA